ncbi:hypothetical protein H671_1g4325 [Cricetulus griseus]|nr:hypothetical protein H671_1g4325 [Cricetulus griseus]
MNDKITVLNVCKRQMGYERYVPAILQVLVPGSIASAAGVFQVFIGGSQDVVVCVMVTNVSQILVVEEVSVEPHGFHGVFIPEFRQELL